MKTLIYFGAAMIAKFLVDYGHYGWAVYTCLAIVVSACDDIAREIRKTKGAAA